MAEADERHVGAKALEHVRFRSVSIASIQPHLARARSRSPDILPHRRLPAGTSTASRRARAFPARSCRSRRRTRAPARPAASRCRAARRRHRRRQRAHRRQLGEDVQVRRARQAVGADRDAHARRVEVLDRRRAGAGVAVAARTGHERRAARRQPLRDRPPSSARRARRARCASRKPLSSRNCTGLPPGGTHAGSHAPSSSSSARHGPPPVRMNSTSSADSDRWTLHGANGSRSIARRIARNTQRRRPNTAHAPPGSRARGRPAPSASSVRARLVDERARVGGVEPNQLVEDDRRRAGCARAART